MTRFFIHMPYFFSYNFLYTSALLFPLLFLCSFRCVIKLQNNFSLFLYFILNTCWYKIYFHRRRIYSEFVFFSFFKMTKLIGKNYFQFVSLLKYSRNCHSCLYGKGKIFQSCYAIFLIVKTMLNFIVQDFPLTR